MRKLRRGGGSKSPQVRYKHGKDTKFHTQNHCSCPMLNRVYNFPSLTFLKNKEGQGRNPFPPVFATWVNRHHHQPGISGQSSHLPGLCPLPSSKLHKLLATSAGEQDLSHWSPCGTLATAPFLRLTAHSDQR